MDDDPVGSLQLIPKTVRNRLKNHPKWPESFHSSHGKTSPMTDRYTAVFKRDCGRKSIWPRMTGRVLVDHHLENDVLRWLEAIRNVSFSEPQVYKSWCNIIHMILLGALSHVLHLLRVANAVLCCACKYVFNRPIFLFFICGYLDIRKCKPQSFTVTGTWRPTPILLNNDVKSMKNNLHIKDMWFVVIYLGQNIVFRQSIFSEDALGKLPHGWRRPHFK